MATRSFRALAAVAVAAEHLAVGDVRRAMIGFLIKNNFLNIGNSVWEIFYGNLLYRISLFFESWRDDRLSHSI